MHTLWLMRATALIMLLLALGACGPPAADADITLTDDGCASAGFVLPNTREPRITLANTAAAPMVFSLPAMNRWAVLGPGERAAFELPRYIMGRFDFFCLSEAEHTRLGGGNPFLCALEPGELAAVARSQGIFEIERHDRIQEVLGR